MGGGLTYIGVVGNVAERVAALQSGSPVSLTALWQSYTTAATERQLHKALADKRAHGEWFDLGPDPVALITAALGASLAGSVRQ